MKKNKTIILAAGGTGGHFFPAVATAEELEKSGADIHLITDLRCKKYISDNIPATTHTIDLHIKNDNIINKILSIFKTIKACIKSFFLIRRIKADAIIGFGGYPTLPHMLAAKILRIPTIIQEQNCFLGKTNRMFATNAKIIALSYEETDNIQIDFKSKILFTGDIIRKSVKNMSKKSDFTDDNFHLFVVGGSQGAQIFNNLIPDTLDHLRKLNPSLKLSITQQVSENDLKELEKRYNALNIKNELSDFFHDIGKIYAKSHLVISRSGASTIAELSNIGLPAIFIPYPYAAEDHQYFNAIAISENDASWYYKQSDISANILAHKLNELIENRKLLNEASLKLLKRKSNGAKTLADTVLKIIL